jgi:hypothetical protein
MPPAGAGVAVGAAGAGGGGGGGGGMQMPSLTAPMTITVSVRAKSFMGHSLNNRFFIPLLCDKKNRLLIPGAYHFYDDEIKSSLS